MPREGCKRTELNVDPECMLRQHFPEVRLDDDQVVIPRDRLEAIFSFYY